jgi:hypothetical protein
LKKINNLKNNASLVIASYLALHEAASFLAFSAAALSTLNIASS